MGLEQELTLKGSVSEPGPSPSLSDFSRGFW